MFSATVTKDLLRVLAISVEFMATSPLVSFTPLMAVVVELFDMTDFMPWHSVFIF